MQNGEIPRSLLWRHAALMAGREFCYSVEVCFYIDNSIFPFTLRHLASFGDAGVKDAGIAR